MREKVKKQKKIEKDVRKTMRESTKQRKCSCDTVEIKIKTFKELLG